VTSGTQLTQPLTTLLKIRPVNDMAQAELKASQRKMQQTENDVALQGHQLYKGKYMAPLYKPSKEKPEDAKA
jgi:hypothetical protein